MRVTLDIRFKTADEESIKELAKLLYGPFKDRYEIDGRYLTAHKEIMSEDELDEMTYYLDELPMHVAVKGDIDFDYDGNLEMLDDFTQIQIEYRDGKYRYQDVEEEAYYVGEKKDGKIRLRGADEDEHAMFFD